MILSKTTGVELQRRLNDAGPEHKLVEDGNVGPKTLRALFHYMGAGRFSAVLGGCASVDFEKYQINTSRRIGHWFAQFGHESRNFQVYEENLKYTAKRLTQIWHKRFPTIASALPYAWNGSDADREDQALANKVYGGRIGNQLNGVNDDDGWRYRGRGPQITGLDNYKLAERGTGLPLVANPDLASHPENFVLLACDYWDRQSINRHADRDDLTAVTEAVNGGRIGLSERKALLTKINKVLP
jgi:putative chitinase